VNLNFSFVILTYNEEIHLSRLLKSIKALNAKIYILDSGSTDNTLNIAADFGAEVKINPFENHPKQWDFALNNFSIETPWIIGLDADQIVTQELFDQLSSFNNEKFKGIDGIYFNRKNFFQGHWIRYGGYYPLYLLKMFRTGVGFSDLNENMDHRFIVPGRTIVWKNAHLLEENLKENNIDFWFAKHERYSDLVAQEEIERMQKIRLQSIQPNFLGNPDERKAWLKRLWWKMPLGIRPYLYYSFRMVFQLGILDSKTGRRFHYLQGLWFRKKVDKKIMQLKRSMDSGS